MIDLSRLPEMFLIGSAGAFCIEAIKAYELRSKLHLKRYSRLLRSPLFWLVSMLFVAVAGVIAWAFNENNPNATVAQLFATGMGASSILKRISETVTASQRLVAGDADEGSLGDMFS